MGGSWELGRHAIVHARKSERELAQMCLCTCAQAADMTEDLERGYWPSYNVGGLQPMPSTNDGASVRCSVRAHCSVDASAIHAMQCAQDASYEL